MRLPQHLLKISDLTPSQIEAIVAQAFLFKQSGRMLAHERILSGKSIALIFEKNSLRTRVAFENAIAHLGGHPIYLSAHNILYRAADDTSRESVNDITHNLNRLTDGIAARVNRHATLHEIVSLSHKPVINLLCDEHHPTQALADLMTIRWHKKKKKDLKVAFVGDGNNVATSLMEICAAVGIDFAIASPARYAIKETSRVSARTFARKSGSTLLFVNDPKEAVYSADVVYADTFVSMGDEAETAIRRRAFKNYRVDSNLMRHANKDALFMHCLPAHRGEEVTADVIDGLQSVVFDQAECRLHVARALLFLMYGGRGRRAKVY